MCSEFSLRLPQNFSVSGINLDPSRNPSYETTLSDENPSISYCSQHCTDESLARLGAAELRVLLLEARSAISSPIVSTLIIGVVLSNLFSTFNPISASAGTFSSTPKIDRLRSVVSSRGSMTYTEPFDFLDSQAIFDMIFGPNLTMLRLAPDKNKQCASEDTEYIATNLLEFFNFCQLHIFAILFNFNMLERTRMIHRKCLPIFL